MGYLVIFDIGKEKIVDFPILLGSLFCNTHANIYYQPSLSQYEKNGQQIDNYERNIHRSNRNRGLEIPEEQLVSVYLMHHLLLMMMMVLRRRFTLTMYTWSIFNIILSFTVDHCHIISPSFTHLSAKACWYVPLNLLIFMMFPQDSLMDLLRLFYLRCLDMKKDIDLGKSKEDEVRLDLPLLHKQRKEN